MSLTEHLIEDLQESAPVLKEFMGDTPCEYGIILGSGWNVVADQLQNTRQLPFADVPHMTASTVDWHRGQFVIGTLPRDCMEQLAPVLGVPVPDHDVWVLCMQGRLHAYEGLGVFQVAFPVWLMHMMGITTLITTNAAGAINPTYHVGDFCVMADHINLTGRNPLVGVQPHQIADRFVPMKDAYDVHLRQVACKVAQDLQIPLHEGVYVGLLGPSFETPAEIRAFGILGADTVAMSVCEETIAARHSGMRVMGLSLCSNMACGVFDGNPTDSEIVDVAAKREADFLRLLVGIILSD